MSTIDFNDDQIRELFGDEAAESESLTRLLQYYVKTPIHKQFTSNAPLRILVGHKGVGKSAVVRVAKTEDDANGTLSILIKPDDISDIGGAVPDFLKLIKAWKKGLKELLAKKALSTLGENNPKVAGKLRNFAGGLVDFLYDCINTEDKLLKLEPAKQRIANSFIANKIMNVYVDDLDRGWQGRQEDINRISALLNAARDISSENEGIRFRIALRSDVYFLYRTSDESTDKIGGSVLWQAWTNHEIFLLLIKRVATFFEENIDEKWLEARRQSDLSFYLDRIMEPKFQGRGKWNDAPMRKILLSLIRKRPRDLVKLCTLAARKANAISSNVITTKNLEDIFKEYSQDRVQDTINEYRYELPSIERLVLNLKPNREERKSGQGYMYTTDGLIKKLKNLMAQGDFVFAGNKRATEKQLLTFLYKINFLTARKNTDIRAIRYYFEENRYLSNEMADFGYSWEVHPAYRWALQPDEINEIFNSLDLSDE